MGGGSNRKRGKLLSEEVHDMYWEPNTIGMIQSRSIRWVRHVARMGKKHKDIQFLVFWIRSKEGTRKT